MTTHLRIRELAISTRSGDYAYLFDAPVSVIVGPVGAGKSTIIELIKHVLGGSATLTQVVEEHVLRARLHVEVGERRLVLQRATQGRTNTVDVYDSIDGEQLASLRTRESSDGESLSQYLLGALNFPALVIPRSRTKAAGATSALTFNDLFSYVYLQQAEIDRSVVNHLETSRDPKRRAAFELFFGLTDPALIALEVSRGKNADELIVARQRAETVRTFLKEAAVGDEQELRAERRRLTAALESARRDLAQLRNEVEALSAAEDALREEVRTVDKAAAEARDAVTSATAAVARREALVAQLELDIERHGRMEAAVQRLASIDFQVCPRCLQALTHRKIPFGHCSLCLQPDTITSELASTERDETLRQLHSQLSETVSLLEVDRIQLSRLEDLARGNELTAAALRGELDARTRDLVSPRFEAIAHAAAVVASSEARLDAVDRITSYWVQYRIVEGTIASLLEEARRINDAIDAARARLAARRQRIHDLSEIFDEIVRFLQVPWYESARIDSDSYLPIVNGRPFQKLAVAGGMKTIVNLAYRLALLTYGLAHPDETRFPDLLIVDSPRKNVGAAPEDRALTERIYRRFRMLADSYGDRVQILIADNDLPPIAAEFVHAWPVDYEHPSVPGVMHPGPENVERIGAIATPESEAE